MTFVAAAALRDATKTIQELQQENGTLKNENQLLRSVEITGPSGQPVYARAQIDLDGHWSGNLWRVDLSRTTAKTAGTTTTENAFPVVVCTLKELCNVEIRVGGIRHASFSAPFSTFMTFFDLDGDEDTDNAKLVQFCFSGGSGGHWLSCLVHNWPRKQWSVALNGHEPEDGVQFLINRVAAEAPLDKTLEFKEVCFMRDEINAFLTRVNIDHRCGGDGGELDSTTEGGAAAAPDRRAEIFDAVLLQYDCWRRTLHNTPVPYDATNPVHREEKSTFSRDVTAAMLQINGLERCLSHLADEGGVYFHHMVGALFGMHQGLSSSEFMDRISFMFQ